MVSASTLIESQQHLAQLRSLNLLGVTRTPAVVLLPDDPARPPSRSVLKLHLIRHGQGFHNLLGDEYRARGVHFSSTGDDTSANNPYVRSEVWDPPLTALGRAQAKALRPRARELSPQLVLCSPLSRAAGTAIMAFEDWLGKVPFLAVEDAREQMGVHTCDARNPLADVMRDFPQLDFSELRAPETDELWHPTEREPHAAVCERAHRLLLWLRARKEREVALATHSAFLFMLLNAVVTADGMAEGEGTRSWFETGEMRTVCLEFRD
jgi:broad specificity phosphatase PhoE